MKGSDHKLAILRQLSQEAEPVSLAKLLEKFQTTYTGRTVRRWLNQLIDEGLVIKSGHTRNAKYSVVKRRDNTANHERRCFGSESLKVIAQITRPLYERQPVAYNNDWFNSYKPNTSFYLSNLLQEQLLRAGRRDSNDPAGTYAHKIFNRLLIDLSYNSSRLEGNTYSLLDTERLLLHGNIAEGKLDEEKVMILNHREAIRYLVDNAPRITTSKQVICTLHYLLSDGLVEPRYAGGVRDHGVRISGSTYLPFEDPKTLQLQLEQITDKAIHIKDPFEQSLFLLVHISYVQAFIDVNKRTARLSANIPLITQNLVPLSFNDVGREDYMSAIIAVYELQDVRPMVDLFVFSYMRTCAGYDSTVRAIGFDEVRVRYRKERRAFIREMITSGLVGDKLQDFVQTNTRKTIPKKDQKAFIQTVIEDLDQIDQNRIAGLGITPEELDAWQIANSSG